MTNGWTTRKLGDICTTIQDGAHESPKKQFDTPGEGRFLYITSKNIRTNYLDLEDVSYVDWDFHDRIYPRCQPRVGDVLLTKDGANTGNVTLNTINEPFSLLSSVCLIKTIPTALQPAFLCYYIQSPDGLKSITGQMTGAAIKRIILRDIKLATIPLPPLPEQKRIVGILDEAFEGIATAKANAEKNLQNARAIFESQLQSVFTKRCAGWVEKKLSEVCAITSTLVDPRKDTFLDFIHVGAGNIESRTGVFVGLKTAREEGLISGKFLFDESMVLYSKIRPYLMKVARPNFKGLCSADIYPLAPLQDETTRDYLFHLLLSKRFTDYAIQGSARAGMPKVNREHLFEFNIWLPDVRKQVELARALDDLQQETQRLESIYQHKLAALKALKKSLLHQAFTGKL
jgi:type I restriction enzyme S subunit